MNSASPKVAAKSVGLDLRSRMPEIKGIDNPYKKLGCDGKKRRGVQGAWQSVRQLPGAKERMVGGASLKTRGLRAKVEGRD